MPEVDVADDMIDVFVTNSTGLAGCEEFCARAPTVPSIDFRSCLLAYCIDTPQTMSGLARLSTNRYVVYAYNTVKATVS